HFRRALAVLEPHGASVVLEMVETLQGLSRVLAAQGQFDEAERVARRAVALSGGEGQAGLPFSVRSPAEGESPPGAGERETASPERETASRGGQEGEPQLLAASLDALARLYQAQGRLTEA